MVLLRRFAACCSVFRAKAAERGEFKGSKESHAEATSGLCGK